MQRIWRLLLIPSTFGALVWVFLMCLLALNVIRVDVSPYAVFVFLYVIACFLLSNTLMSRYFVGIDLVKIGKEMVCDNLDGGMFLFSTVLGLGGLYLYIVDFSQSFGGISQFFYVFFTDPLQIRALAVDTTSMGFQISYFSWLSVFYCVLILATGHAKTWPIRISLVVLGVLEFALNLLFIDRTRPTILFVICALGFGVSRFGYIKHPLRLYAAIFLGPLVIFFGQAMYTGKYYYDEGLFSTFLIYILGGFGYFSSLLTNGIPDYSLERTFYPIAKVLEAFGMVGHVPPQILDDRSVPFVTNVGTFLEPLISDGGLLLVIVGAPLIIILIDLLSLFALRARSIPGLFVWANMVVTVLFSFFVPKYNAAYMYLFVAIYVGLHFLRSRRSSQIVV